YIGADCCKLDRTLVLTPKTLIFPPARNSMTIKEEVIELPTPTGPMRTCIFRPTADGKYPGLLLFSEIFQITGPIRRTASLLAGHGFVVAPPEIFHDLEPIGAVIPYDQAGPAPATNDSTLDRSREIQGEMRMIFGRQDPHVPREGRRIYDAMADANIHFTWHEFNGQHAFMRDEGPRYDPALAHLCYTLVLELFNRK